MRVSILWGKIQCVAEKKGKPMPAVGSLIAAVDRNQSPLKTTTLMRLHVELNTLQALCYATAHPINAPSLFHH
jgi:hypothetical protein